jgi:hypothetical protein
MKTLPHSVLSEQTLFNFDASCLQEESSPLLLDMTALIHILPSVRDKIFLSMCTGNYQIVKTIIDGLLEKEKERDLHIMKFKNTTLCPICYEHTGVSATLTSCGHLFCQQCIQHSLDTTRSCPECRQEITSLVPCGRLITQLSETILTDATTVAGVILQDILPRIKKVHPDIVYYLVDLCRDRITAENVTNMLSTALQTQSLVLLNIALQFQSSNRLDIIQFCDIIYSTKEELHAELLLTILRYFENNNEITMATQCVKHESLFFLRSYRRHIAYLKRYTSQYTTNNSVAYDAM